MLLLHYFSSLLFRLFAILSLYHHYTIARPIDPTTMRNNILSNNNASNVWDPSTISNIALSAIMVFIGLIAIWQAYHTSLASRRTTDGMLYHIPSLVPGHRLGLTKE